METSPNAEIANRISKKGKISFAEFMEVALYHPNGGYYAQKAPGGAHSDYYTSPTVHPAFGSLIATQLHRLWELLEHPTSFYAIEIGAGVGHLARDVTYYTQRLSNKFNKSLHYITMDRTFPNSVSSIRRADNEHISAIQPPFKNVVGCFLSNELLDAFPVHRFQIHGGAVKEVFVGLNKGEFTEILAEPSSPRITERTKTLGIPLPEGYRGEINLSIRPWVADISAALNTGFVLTIDFARSKENENNNLKGSLQTYYRHSYGSNPYQHIGAQDITAAVDFQHVILEGLAAGLEPILLCTQAEYLHNLGMAQWLQNLRTQELTQIERDANMIAMRDLVNPDGLGNFKVLIQEKGTGVTSADMLTPSEMGMDSHKAPLLLHDNLRLLESRYPHAVAEFQQMWPTQ